LPHIPKSNKLKQLVPEPRMIDHAIMSNQALNTDLVTDAECQEKSRQSPLLASNEQTPSFHCHSPHHPNGNSYSVHSNHHQLM